MYDTGYNNDTGYNYNNEMDTLAECLTSVSSRC